MTPGLPVAVCVECGHAVFPPRALCPRCGAERWRQEAVEQGVVEERTALQRRAALRAEGDGAPVYIASVRTAAGPVVIARSPDDAPPGAAVRLEMEGGAPVAWLGLQS